MKTVGKRKKDINTKKSEGYLLDALSVDSKEKVFHEGYMRHGQQYNASKGSIKQRVLLVEDNFSLRKYISSILESKYDVTGVTNGREALDYLKYKYPDLIICNMMTPNINGLELAMILKKDINYRNIPLITLSGRLDEATKLNALSVGIDDLLIKPFNPRELLIRAKNRITFYREYMRETKPVPNPPMGYQDRLIRSIRHEVERRIGDHTLQVTELARFACMSNATLTRLLKKRTGLTPWRFIREIRLNRAMELLKNQEYQTIQQVVFAIGMEDASHFTQVFQKRFGKKPSEVVAECLSDYELDFI